MQEEKTEKKIFVNLSNVPLGTGAAGIGQYAMNLLEGFRQIGRLHALQLLVNSSDADLVRSLFPEAGIRIVPAMIPDTLPGIRRYQSSWRVELLRSFLRERAGIPWMLRKEKTGLLFHPFNAMFIHVSNKIPTVVTVHDLFYRNFPEAHSRKMRLLLNLCYRTIIHRPRQLIVPSAFVRGDIMKYYPGVDRNKVRVIANPILIRDHPQHEIPVPRPYLLSVNSIQAHKNLKTLILAQAILEKLIPHHLVLVGQGSKEEEGALTALIHQTGVKRVIRTGYVNEAQRNDLYRHASCFISPSLHEGFGMTPIEAALCNTPILVTRETSLPEVTREMAAYYEPADDPRALAEKIHQMLNNPPGLDELHRISRVYRQCYDPKKIARAYDLLFQCVMNP